MTSPPVQIAGVTTAALAILSRTRWLARHRHGDVSSFRKDVFVIFHAVERAGLRTLNEEQAIEYEIQSNRGKECAVNLRVK
jgi:cold shock CspA family protein